MSLTVWMKRLSMKLKQRKLDTNLKEEVGQMEVGKVDQTTVISKVFEDNNMNFKCLVRLTLLF